MNHPEKMVPAYPAFVGAVVLVEGKILQPKKEKRKSEFLALADNNETLNIVF